MRNVYLLFSSLTLLLLLCSTPAKAIDLYGFGSYWDQSDADGTWGGGIGLSLPLLTDHLRLDGRMYCFEDSDIDSDDRLSLTPFDLGLQVHLLPGGSVDPYVLGGVSYIYADADRFDVDSSFGGYLGAGLDVELGTSLFKLFGEALYRFSEIDNPFGDDIDVGGLTCNIGLKFHF